MIDRAAILMEQGASIACHRVEGMNDNMSHSHYHTYFELYFLEGGERHHVMQDQQYETKVGSFMIFAPYIINFIDITPRFLPLFAEKFSFEYLRKSHKIPLFSNKLVTDYIRALTLACTAA